MCNSFRVTGATLFDCSGSLLFFWLFSRVGEVEVEWTGKKEQMKIQYSYIERVSDVEAILNLDAGCIVMLSMVEHVRGNMFQG